MLEVWNPRRESRKTPEEMREKVIHAYKYASGPLGGAHPAAVFSPITGAQATSPAVEKFEEDWVQTPQGKIIKCFKNLMLYLRCPRYGIAGVFAFNEFTNRVEFANPAPWHRGETAHLHTSISDDDLALLKGYLANRMGYEASIEDILRAITNVAYHNRFHPVREYLTGLKWDGVKRLDFWLRDYLGAEDTAYVRACARKTLCAAVMRVMRPAIKFDHVLVLEGEQDIGKSTAVEILGGRWATDAPVDPHSRDTVDMMVGRWIIEMAEMEVTRRSDEEALKAFIVRKTDLARLAYARKTCEFKRQSIFIATKNPKADGTYLTDPTGNRRWWPVRCTHVAFAGLKGARDMLFAEAVQVAPKEKLFMETAELKSAAKAEAAQRYAEHEWTERIAGWLHERPALTFVTARDVFIDAMRGDDAKLDRKACLAIAQCLRLAGWERKVEWHGGRARIRTYSRPFKRYIRPRFLMDKRLYTRSDRIYCRRH